MIFSQIKECDLKRFITLCVLLATAVLGAQATGRLSLEEARQLALQNNNSYQAKLAEVEAADWSSKAALSSFLPTLSLDGNWLYMEPAQTVMSGTTPITLNHDIRSFGFSLSQPLFLGGKIWHGYKMAQLSQEISASGLEAQKLATLTELNTLYLTLLQTQDLQKISDMDRQSAELNLQIAQLKYDNGLLSTADYLRFKSQLASKDVSLLQARTALQLSQLNLRNFLNLDYLPIADDLPDSDNDPLILALNSYDSGATQNLSAAALAAGKNNNTTLSVLENSLELSRRSYEISKGAFLPTLMLIGSSEFSENGIDRYKFESSSQIILNASIPLLPQLGNYANLQKAKFNYRKAQLEAKTATDGILLGTEAAVLNLVSAAKQVRASKLALDFTRQSFEQLQQRFRMDLISPKDLLDAELMLSAARIAYSNSVYNYHKARVSLMQTIGISDAATLDEMIFTGVK